MLSFSCLAFTVLLSLTVKRKKSSKPEAKGTVPKVTGKKITKIIGLGKKKPSTDEQTSSAEEDLPTCGETPSPGCERAAEEWGGVTHAGSPEPWPWNLCSVLQASGLWRVQADYFNARRNGVGLILSCFLVTHAVSVSQVPSGVAGPKQQRQRVAELWD